MILEQALISRSPKAGIFSIKPEFLNLPKMFVPREKLLKIKMSSSLEIEQTRTL